MRILVTVLATLPAVAVSVFAAPAAAQSYKMYKWVDERGAVTYSDRKPIDPKAVESVEPVSRSLSLYTPDTALLQAVAAARREYAQPAFRTEPVAPRHLAPTTALAAAPLDPCAQMDCTEYSGGSYPYPGVLPVRRRTPHLHQAVLPAGAIAGTVNAPGMIPGQTGANPILPGPFNYLPSGRVRSARGPLEPPRTPATGH